MFVSAHGNVSDSQAELDAVSAQIAALPKPQRPVIDADVQGAQAQRAQAVANVLGSRVAWDAVLRDVSRVLPENVWLSSLQAQVAADRRRRHCAGRGDRRRPASRAAPTGAQIDGYTYAQTDVARLLARLATLPTLSNVTLTSSKVEIEGSEVDRPLPDRCRPEHRRFLMNGLLKQKKAVIALGAVGAVALLAAAWFLVVAPQQSKADELDRQVAAAQSRARPAQDRARHARPRALTVKAGDTYRLAKALPDATNMAGMILDLNRLAARHKLAFTSITPGAPLAATGYIAPAGRRRGAGPVHERLRVPR